MAKVLVSDPVAAEGVAILRRAGLEVDVRTGLTPAARATERAFILSPNASSTAGVGPMNVAPASATAIAKAGFSLRKP